MTGEEWETDIQTQEQIGVSSPPSFPESPQPWAPVSRDPNVSGVPRGVTKFL